MNAEFVDTNVLIYAYDLSAGDKHARARKLLSRLWRERRGVLSTQVMKEFYTVVTRKIPRPLTPAQARARLRGLARWPVFRPSPADLLEASELSEEHRLSFWDALVIHSAQSLGAATLWTEDLQAGRRFGALLLRDPFR